MTTPDLLPCPFCGQPKDWIDNQHEGLSPACTNQDCFAYAIPMYFCKEGDLPTRAAPRWIPVTERLPEYLKVVATSDGTYVGAGFVHNDGQWILDHKTEMQSVTHWMPLPLPPKEVEG